MADSNALSHDPRRRNLAILGVVAVVMVVLAALALWHQASLVAPKYTPHAFFPNLAGRNRDVARIHIVSKKYGAFDVTFNPSSGWVLPAKHNYPAQFSLVRGTIVGMAGLETVAPKTNRADWLHYLDLDTPQKGGKGIEITLFDEHNHVIASLITGKSKDIGDTGTASGLFVRTPNSDQSWLVRSVFTPTPNPDDWMNKNVIDVDRSDIQEADVTPPSGPSYVVRRDKPSQTDFHLVDVPKGRQIADNGQADNVGAGLVNFSFDNVEPAAQFNFAKTPQFVTKTFGGLIVTVNILKKDKKYWVAIAASAAKNKPKAADQARTINKNAGGWAFEIPAYIGAQLTTPLESFLKSTERHRKAARKG